MKIEIIKYWGYGLVVIGASLFIILSNIYLIDALISSSSQSLKSASDAVTIFSVSAILIVGALVFLGNVLFIKNEFLLAKISIFFFFLLFLYMINSFITFYLYSSIKDIYEYISFAWRIGIASSLLIFGFIGVFFKNFLEIIKEKYGEVY